MRHRLNRANAIYEDRIPNANGEEFSENNRCSEGRVCKDQVLIWNPERGSTEEGISIKRALSLTESNPPITRNPYDSCYQAYSTISEEVGKGKTVSLATTAGSCESE